MPFLISAAGGFVLLLLVLGGLVMVLTWGEDRADIEPPRESTEEKKNKRILREIERWREGK